MSPTPDATQPVVGCIPWDANEYPPDLYRLWRSGVEQMLAEGAPVPRPYRDSISATCARCTIRVAVGPRQAVQLGEFDTFGVKYTILCLLCAVFDVAAVGSRPVVSLGNPENDR